MSVEVTMPKLSDTMEEGTIIRWGVKVGDRVARGDVIAEVETDKAAMEMEAFEEGVVAEIKVGEGETVPVGTVIAVLNSGQAEAVEEKEAEPAAGTGPKGTADVPAEEEKEEEQEEPPSEPEPQKEKTETASEAEKEEAPEAEEEKTAASGEPEDSGEKERVPISPAARKLAEEKGLSLATLQGTGPGGRIVLADVEKKVGGEEKSQASAAPEGKKGKESEAAPGSKARRIRRVVARKMEESWKNIPHFYVTVAVDVSDALRFHDDVKVGLNDFILAAVGRALRDHPGVNCLWREGQAVPQDDINVAFAVATDEGLYSPVLRNCDGLSLREIHRRSRELQEKIKKDQIRSEDIDGATFTVSNMGMLGVESFSAIITPPQAAALAVGEAVREALVAENGELEVVQRLRLTLSADHRVLDGADGAAFLKSVKNYLERPLQLILSIE